MKILVVDDEVRIAEAIKQGLELDGYAVDVEHDGEDGYNAARADEYDVIVLDVMMPCCRRHNADYFAYCERSKLRHRARA